MNVSELYHLTNWVTIEIINTQIVQKYQQLSTILQKNSQPNQQKQPFETQKNELIQSLDSVPLSSLTKDQLKYLKIFNIYQAVGKKGIEILEDILYKNVIDVATSYQKIQEIIKKLNTGIQKSNQIKTGLDGCLIKEDYEIKNEVLIRISFMGHANMSNVSDFKSWGNKWYDIGRGIAMAHGSTPEDIKIVGADNGSVIIVLSTIAGIAVTVSGIILSALKVAEKVLDIRKKAEEIRGMKLSNDKVAKDLEKESENEKKSGIEKITHDVSIRLKLDPQNEGDKVNALAKSIKNLVNFIENGGEIDFVMPQTNENENNENEDSYKELQNSFQEIKKLESKLKLLEHKKEADI